MWLSQKTVLRLPPFYLDRLLMLRVLKRLLLHRLHRLQNADILEVRAFGQFLVPVRRGFKVFDLQRKIVIKLLQTSSSKIPFVDEIEQVRKASALRLAAPIRNWNVLERWYEEDFIAGYPAYAPYTNFDSFIRLYQPQIETYHERMILADRPHWITIRDYLDETMASLDRNIYGNGLTTEKLGPITLFADAMAKRLQPMGNQEICLVFSHGDFSRNNIVITENGLVPLDWEHASRRTPLHDMYWYFLLEMCDGHLTANMASRLINDTILLLSRRLKPSAPDLAKTLGCQAEPYRWLFYLEFLDRCFKDEQVDDGTILTHHVYMFTRYEKELRR